jgi:hypothetical protein
MNPQTHIIVNTSISLPLKYIFGWDWSIVLLFVLAGGVLIDLDHPVYFILKYKTINLKKWLLIAKKMESKMEPGFYVFHSPEFNILLLIAAFFSKIALIIFFSNLIHITLDIIKHYKYHRNFLWMKRWSIICALIN